jgi:hypothetical protein
MPLARVLAAARCHLRVQLFGETTMSAITVNDLPLDRDLDRAAMTCVRGGGAPWLYGWITPYVASSPSAGGGVNVFDITNNYYADQMINQFQSVSVNNTGANSNITVSPGEHGANARS